MTDETPDAREIGLGRYTAEIAADGADRLPTKAVRAKRPPPSARCAACGDAGLSALPAFAAGSGVATRPFADDVICNACGHIGMPALVLV